MLIKLSWILILSIILVIVKGSVLDVKNLKIQYVSRDIIIVKHVGI